ncbi:L,D-transpeptidase [Paenibacillus sp. CMAA1739]|uniref:L,D-transpeptidase n=1 Tax=Paenibacillus ottowii TaxID=2315729 RepID=UPI002DB87626|nr:L,D-transpeptidase [Paenibacillus sp. CMAA1739]MEC4566339.1 L,D-transpeptidase [Paenibacillus sp. CMAA1739]
MDHSPHLKSYVKKHPDNKMAWYLLGKEYESSGQEGKANYCFNRAGEVFEAFEHKQIPADVWMEYQDKLVQMSKEKERRTARTRHLLTVLMVLLLIWVPSANSPSISPKSASVPSGTEHAAVDHVEGAKAATADPKEKAQNGEPYAGGVFTAQARQGSGAGTAFTELLAKTSQMPSKITVLGMEQRGTWLIWREGMKPLLSVQNKGNGGLAVQSYDAAACACKPSDSETLRITGLKWAAGQEEQAVLNSAMRAFRSQHQRLPQSLEELTRDFPSNTMYGTTDGMKKAFTPLRNVLASSGQGTGKTEEQNTGSAAENSLLLASSLHGRPFLGQPLRIVIDKSRHRLALVSGNILIRNYPIGLGGDRTPEGKFVITDKVVNPNGKSNGEFGSRGMQLSATNYAIHGTNEPDSIGKNESLGCVRMGKEDVEELFALVPSGTEVVIGNGGLPDQVLVPGSRFTSEPQHDQTNPRKTYHWLN